MRFLLGRHRRDLHGYQSDTSRTWCVAGAERERTRARGTPCATHSSAPSKPCGRARCAATSIARRAPTLAAAGFGGGYERFTHRLGHGIGLEGHEDPYFDGGEHGAARARHDALATNRACMCSATSACGSRTSCRSTASGAVPFRVVARGAPASLLTGNAKRRGGADSPPAAGACGRLGRNGPDGITDCPRRAGCGS
jgi:hypothetical protein